MLARRRVVLLAEAGSGKSREFQERAKILTEMGRFAFVVRLDQLADTSLESVLGPHESARLLTWRRGTGEGYFFLDSVDEAKFSRMTDFDSALNRFRDAVKDDLARAHIYLSSRITEWQPKSDASKVLSQLPMFPVLKKHSENQALMSHSSPADLRYTAWQGCACRSGVCDS